MGTSSLLFLILSVYLWFNMEASVYHRCYFIRLHLKVNNIPRGRYRSPWLRLITEETYPIWLPNAFTHFVSACAVKLVRRAASVNSMEETGHKLLVLVFLLAVLPRGEE